MKMPPSLLGAAVLFWGWQVDLLVYALPMALVIEGARWVAWRWELSDRDFNRVADLTSIGFVLVVIYQFDERAFHAVYAILALSPLIVFVLLVIQVYSTRGVVKLTALFLSMRRAVARGELTESRSVDLGAPYFVICLLAAGAGEVRGDWYIAGVAALGGIALWHVRPRPRSTSLWVGLFAVAVVAGYLVHAGLVQLRAALEPIVLEWVQEHFWSPRDPYRSYTAIGSIGRLKQSDRILLRVTPRRQADYPRLLREASYTMYSRGIWLAGKGSFEELEPLAGGTAWPLHPGALPERTVRISTYLHRGRGLLAVPNGTHRIERLPVADLAANRLGALKITEGPGLVDYDARYNPEASYDEAPNEHDLVIPANHETLIRDIAAELELARLDPPEVPRRLIQYFGSRFDYTVVLGESDRHDALAAFLTESRAGHCEYFATATVLLLRAAGIPARYATGYSVQEWSELEQSYVVRERHAHSWALAHVDGRWRDVDSTPAGWVGIEASAAPWWEGAYDLWAWLRFRLARWRWGESDEGSRELLLYLLIPLGLALGWRLLLQERVARQRRDVAFREDSVRQGADSEFYAIERLLTVTGPGRRPGETVTDWLNRCEVLSAEDLAEVVHHILPLHYRYRFDPRGLAASEREALSGRVAAWLRHHELASPSHRGSRNYLPGL